MCYDRRYLALYHDLDQYIYKLTAGNSDYDAWKAAFDKVMVYWKSTPRNYSAYAGMFTMDSKAKGLSTYIPMTNRSLPIRPTGIRDGIRLPVGQIPVGINKQ